MPEIRSFEHRIANNRERKENNRILNYVPLHFLLLNWESNHRLYHLS
jgi:hypothetical protein